MGFAPSAFAVASIEPLWTLELGFQVPVHQMFAGWRFGKPTFLFDIFPGQAGPAGEMGLSLHPIVFSIALPVVWKYLLIEG